MTKADGRMSNGFINTVTYNHLTAELAEHAEVIFAMTRSQDIF